jgi:6-pyruvoyltetrahydropterin/6-carboxytetrahydropterin synthase
MLTRIGKEFRFEAAHHLPEHDGKCQRPHGHSYRVEVTLIGKPIERGPKTGMVVDFGELSAFWKESVEPLLDHRDLNETLDVPVTTAEWIAYWILGAFRARFGAKVERVRVWETASSFAEAPA